MQQGSNIQLYVLIFIAVSITLVLLFVMSRIGSPGGNCNRSRWGCCPDGYTQKVDPFGSNCRRRGGDWDWWRPRPPRDLCRGKQCRHGCDPQTGECYDVRAF